MANPLHRVLIVDPNRSLPEPDFRTRAERGRSIVTDTVTTVSEAVRRLHGAGYDAVLVKVSRPEELSLVLRIKTEVPLARVLAVTPEVLQMHPETELILDRCRKAVDRGQELITQLRDTDEARLRLANRLLPRAGAPIERLVPLLVETDERNAVPLQRAFEKLGIPFPHPVARTLREAKDTLPASPDPMPTLVLVALGSPRTATFEFLSWIRSRETLRNLPVFVLGKSFSPGTRQQLIDAGADAYFSKPTFPGEHEGLVYSVALKWGVLFAERSSSGGRYS